MSTKTQPTLDSIALEPPRKSSLLAELEAHLKDGILEPAQIAYSILAKYGDGFLVLLTEEEKLGMIRARIGELYRESRRAVGQAHAIPVSQSIPEQPPAQPTRLAFIASDPYDTLVDVPGRGWVRTGTCRGEDCLAVADYYKAAAKPLVREARSWRLRAALLETEKAATLYELRERGIDLP